MNGMSINVSSEMGSVPVTIFYIKGDIDSKTYEQLQAQADEAYQAGMRNLVLDLSEVNYVSSAGIRAINHIYKLLRTQAPSESDEAVKKGILDGSFKSPHLKLLNPKPDVSKVLKMTGVDMYIEVYRSQKDAVASF